MSKSSAATASKIPSSSAWFRGPPQSSSSTPTPRSQSPAPSSATPPTSASHSRRPSTLGQQAVSFKDGVGARSPVITSKPGSSVTFGSIDDVSAPISSSPASVPPIKSEGIKSFGSLAASTPSTNTAVNGKPPAPSSAASVTAKPASSTSTAPHQKYSKVDVRKFFQSPSTPSTSSSQLPADTASPSSRPSQLPHTSPPSQPSHPQPLPHHSQPPHFGSFPPSFVPGSGLRPQQQNGATGGGRVPPSPVYPRQVPNGNPSGINVNGRPTGPPPGPPSATTPMSANMPSPRMGTIPGQPPPMQPGQMPVAYPGYYYPYVPPEYMYNPAWPMQHVMPPQPPQGPQGPHPGMSPRNPPQSLHPPGTPTLSPSPAMPAPGHPPHSTPSPHMHTSPLSNATSPPTTPSVSTGPRAPTMDRNAPPFIPSGGRASKVTIKTESGHEVHLDSFKRQSSAFTPSSPIVAPGSPARRAPIRIESEEDKNRRLAESKERERAKKAQEEKLKKEAEERERRKKEEEDKKKKEEERVKKEAEEKERLRKEAEEKEKERVRLEKEEEERKERLRKEEEEKERIRKVEEEERLRKQAEQERLRKEEEEKERAKKEAEEKAKAEAEAAAAVANAKPATIPEQAEDGEIEEDTTPKGEANDKIAEKASLRIDTTVSNHDVAARRRPGPLDLTGTKTQSISAPLPSALATARIIDNLDSVPYPEGIQSPKPELNVNAKQGKFRYDRDFLLQFMAICKERPDSLPPLDAIGLEPSEQTYAMIRSSSGRRPQSGMGPPAARQASIGLGFKPINTAGSFNMGQFATPGNKTDDRFGMSSRSTSMSGGGPAGFPLGRPSPMVRSSSQGGPGMTSHRTRSKRGEKRGDPNKNPGGPGQSSYNAAAAAAQAAAANFEPIVPLEVSANRWVPASNSRKPPVADANSPEVVDRKVKGLLNKLTMEKFESISDQIIDWANKSESEKDGRTLIQVIRLVFEKATDEATWSEMYARLCRKMMEKISSKVQDDSIRNNEGKAIAGGQLFRKYLLNRCQEDFERGWVAKEATALAAATKASEDKAAKDAAENGKDGESALYSEEYYAAQKAKRQGLGLVKFIGELFKLQMLTERIMHECVKKLLSNVDNPEEEEIESLCKLLTTVGQLLDVPKAKAHMDVYFTRMKELTKSPNVNSRMQFMLQDVIELRERMWIPRNQVAAPTTLAAVHEAAAKDRAASEKESHRNLSMSRGGSRRGGDRGEYPQVGPDGWVTPASRPQPKVGDLSHFGKISKTNSMMTFGPNSVFVSKEKGKRESATLTRTSSNMFSMLNSDIAAEVALPSKSSRPPSRKASVDLGAGGVAEAPSQRRKLQLLPRSKPVENKTDDSAVASADSDDESADHGAGSSMTSMTVEEAKKRIEEDSKEFFNVRDLSEAEMYFTKLPVEHRRLLIDKLITFAIDSSQADAELVASLFARAASNNLCSPATFEDGFMPTAEILDDIVIDVPKAYTLFATMLGGAGLDRDEERRTRLASKVDSDKLLGLLS